MVLASQELKHLQRHICSKAWRTVRIVMGIRIQTKALVKLLLTTRQMRKCIVPKSKIKWFWIRSTSLFPTTHHLKAITCYNRSKWVHSLRHRRGKDSKWFWESTRRVNQMKQVQKHSLKARPVQFSWKRILATSRIITRSRVVLAEVSNSFLINYQF